MKLSDFTDDELKAIIENGILNYRNPNHYNSRFGHETVSVGLEIITYTHKNPTDEETDRINTLYEQVLITLDQ